MRLTLPAALSLGLAVAAAATGAQPPRRAAAADSSAVAAALGRARRLVSAGNGATGRAVIDSVLAAATPGTLAYAEALYWRASLAERSADAEHDFRQLAVEYATSARGADALLRLAQLALVRGQPATAREHLVRLLRDHPDAPSQARGQYWLARTAIDANDPAASCEALNAAAAASTPGSDLARQVVALRGRIPRCTLRVAVGSAVAPATAAAPNVTRDPALPNTVVLNGRDSGLGARGSRPPVGSAPAAAPPAAPPVASRTPPATPPATPTTPPARRPSADSGAARATPSPSRAPSPEPRAPAFTVQIAAFPTRAGADETAARLVRRGLDARAVAAGTAPDGGPFRVRVGRYATRAEAAAALRDLKAKGLTGFVADAEP